MSRSSSKFASRIFSKILRRALVVSALIGAACALNASRVLAQAANAPRAAVFSGFPGDDNGGAGRAALQAELRAAGYAVVPFSPAQMSSSGELSTSRLDLLVLPDSHRLPSSSVEPLRNYLTGGGNILACGLPLWSEALSLVNGRWMTRTQSEDAIAKTPRENLLLDFSDGLGAWQRAHGPNDAPGEYSLETDNGSTVLHARVASFKSWNTFIRPLPAPFRVGQSLLTFRARGGAGTKQLSVELSERDGSRWIAVIDLTPQWKNYALPPERFKAWQPPASRSG